MPHSSKPESNAAPSGLLRRDLLAAGGSALVACGLVAGCGGRYGKTERASGGYTGDAVALDPTDIGNATAPFSLPQLPYDRKALAPHITAETLEYHHGKHHQGYVDKLNKLVGDGIWGDEQLATIVARSDGAICQNAGQVWNHSFYWRGMNPKGGGTPDGALGKAISDSFGSYAAFRERFKQTATGQFGSGWGWLVATGGGLEVMATSNADSPLRHGKTPLLTVDVWEHAYYIDFRNRRGDYIDAFLDDLVDWRFVAANHANATGA